MLMEMYSTHVMASSNLVANELALSAASSRTLALLSRGVYPLNSADIVNSAQSVVILLHSCSC